MMNTTETFLYLIACALNGETATVDEVDWDDLYRLSKSHLMTALTAYALQGTAALQATDAAQQKRWSSALDASVKRTMLFNAERKKIAAFLEESGIWHVPLKGALLTGMYPRFGVREFADNDILYDGDHTDTVRRWMNTNGYTLHSDGYVADEYTKPPLYNFEMHSTLFRDNGENADRLAYYAGLLERKAVDEGKRFASHMSNEDFYIYFILHAFKHYDSRGTGFRTVADEYVLTHGERLPLDRAFVDSELQKLGLAAFEQNLRTLADKLLSDPAQTVQTIAALDDDERDMLSFILSCGTFGKQENLIKKELEASSGGKSPSKRRYYLKRIFPGVSRFRYSHPFVYKHKIVYPFFWVYRTAVHPILHRRALKQEIKAVKSIKNNTGDKT